MAIFLFLLYCSKFEVIILFFRVFRVFRGFLRIAFILSF